MTSPSELATLFPSGIHWAATTADTEPDLFPEEARAVERAIDSRRRDFALGRSCARAALARFGVPPAPIPMLSNRAPVWPDGYVGSITHCRSFVAAAVARSTEFAGIGLDAEATDRPLAPRLERLICTSREQKQLRQLSAEAARAQLLLIFSAKEAVYKAVSPVSGVFLGFRDVELNFDVEARLFSAHLAREVAGHLPDFRRLQGRFVLAGGRVITSVVLPAGVL
jgi:4'-phosphopantetheinyl transferase EntD